MIRKLRFETLESRRLLTLLDLHPNDPDYIEYFNKEWTDATDDSFEFETITSDKTSNFYGLALYELSDTRTLWIGIDAEYDFDPAMPLSPGRDEHGRYCHFLEVLKIPEEVDVSGETIYDEVECWLGGGFPDSDTSQPSSGDANQSVVLTLEPGDYRIYSSLNIWGAHLDTHTVIRGQFYSDGEAGIQLTTLEFNDDRDGSPGYASHRGVDFSYSIAGPPLSEALPIEFYWGKDGTVVSDALASVNTQSTEPKAYSWNGDAETFKFFNVPARWGGKPDNANQIIAIIDPENTLGASSEDFATKNTKTLDLHSRDAVLDKALSVNFENAATAIAYFYPGGEGNNGSGKINLSEAEIVLGVDHFNWRQQIYGVPTNWTPITIDGIEDVDEFHQVTRRLKEATYEGSTVRITSDDGSEVEAMFRTLSTPIPFFDPIVLFDSAPQGIAYDPPVPYFNGSPEADPVLRSRSAHMRAFKNNVIWTHDRIDLGEQVVFGPYPDDRQFYYDVGHIDEGLTDLDYSQLLINSIVASTHSAQPGATEGFNLVSFSDSPLLPTDDLEKNDYLLYETELVGVKYDGRNFEVLDSFTWHANVHGTHEGKPSGASSERPLSFIAGGGIFDVKYEDGTPVPGFPATVPSLVPWHNIQYPVDVTDDGYVGVQDLRIVFTALLDGGGELDNEGPSSPGQMVDVVYSNTLTPNDLRVVFNAVLLGSEPPEGEPIVVQLAPPLEVNTDRRDEVDQAWESNDDWWKPTRPNRADSILVPMGRT